ncbi:chemotaxis protein CheD [Cereibacter azotoformans]|uniref:chemotaxis protein CheD n=1 Tax=Cereibacter azotoformans TaxID=43057 RepID=UPI003B20F701
MFDRETSRDDVAVQTIHVMQGACVASDAPNIVYTTILGSCVCTCMCDPIARVGGINHFLLPYAGVTKVENLRYGYHAIEILINSLLKLGANRHRLEAKLFGGGSMTLQLGAVGPANAAFAQQYLRDESINCVARSLGGTRARKIRFHPTSGRVQQMFLTDIEQLPPESPRVRLQRGAGELIYFDCDANSDPAAFGKEMR